MLIFENTEREANRERKICCACDAHNCGMRLIAESALSATISNQFAIYKRRGVVQKYAGIRWKSADDVTRDRQKLPKFSKTNEVSRSSGASAVLDKPVNPIRTAQNTSPHP